MPVRLARQPSSCLHSHFVAINIYSDWIEGGVESASLSETCYFCLPEVGVLEAFGTIARSVDIVKKLFRKPVLSIDKFMVSPQALE